MLKKMLAAVASLGAFAASLTSVPALAAPPPASYCSTAAHHETEHWMYVSRGRYPGVYELWVCDANWGFWLSATCEENEYGGYENCQQY